MTKILTKLPKPDADGRRDLAPLIVVNGYEVHPVLFNAMLSDPDRGRALLASIAESGAEIVVGAEAARVDLGAGDDATRRGVHHDDDRDEALLAEDAPILQVGVRDLAGACAERIAARGVALVAQDLPAGRAVTLDPAAWAGPRD